MKTVKKFTTFDDMKTIEKKVVRYDSSLKNHTNFEKVIMDIRSIKVDKSKPIHSKQ
ncbi:hypothetical protein J2Y60_000551 [Arcicella sp. BE140]|nr:hypothetical protein [Arcicella sp. BE51]MDR6810370.1 hypothetical protein [Arcicella sp. BE140]MDR6821720.1 hypothetical protein [Arcicella sp. BE139]